MRSSGLTAMFLREYKLLVRSQVTLALGIIPPVVYILLFATSMSNMLPQIAYQGEMVAYSDFMVPAIMVMSMIAGATATASSLFQEELGGMTLELWSYPLHKASFIAGKLIATTALVFVQGVVMILAAALIFQQLWAWDRLAALLLGAVSISLCLNSIYLFIATRFRDQQLFMIAINILAPILLFASPSFYPLNQMPMALQIIAWLNPVAYGVTALRDGLFFGFGANLALIGLLCGVALVAGWLTSRSLLGRFQDL